MPDFTAIAGKVAGIISFAAFVPYIFAILKRTARPNRATWWIWTTVGFMIGASYYSSGANHTIWVPVSYIIGPAIIAVLSLKYGEGGWNWFDRSCVIGAGVSVALWWVFSSPLVALLINLFIDLLGALPTIRKSYREPEGEDRTTWVLFTIGNAINVFAIEVWAFAIAVYPIYMFLIDVAILAPLIWPRKKKKD